MKLEHPEKSISRLPVSDTHHRIMLYHVHIAMGEIRYLSKIQQVLVKIL